MIGLTLKADLQGITDLKFTDPVDDPFLYTFTIRCMQCREIHPNDITINLYEQHEISGSRGEANFVFKCNTCGKRSSVNMTRSKNPYTAENSGKPLRMLEIDSRGLDFVSFKADGKFQCIGEESNTKFEEVDLEDGEWYDYDEKSSEEVSITNIDWTFVKK